MLFRSFAATILLFLLKPFSFVNNQRWREEDAFITNYTLCSSLFFFYVFLLKERRKFLGDDEQIVRVPDVLAVHTTCRVFVVV